MKIVSEILKLEYLTFAKEELFKHQSDVLVVFASLLYQKFVKSYRNHTVLCFSITSSNMADEII